jgi:excisionase family DNA binding protein
VSEHERLLLDVATTARLLGISERLTWSLIGRGDLRSVTVGRRRLVPRSCVERFVSELAAGSVAARTHDATATRRP